MEHYRKGNLVNPIEPLIIKTRDNAEIKIEALGYAMIKPSIDIAKISQVGISQRTKTESIAFQDTDFDMLYDFLTSVKQRWESSL